MMMNLYIINELDNFEGGSSRHGQAKCFTIKVEISKSKKCAAPLNRDGVDAPPALALFESRHFDYCFMVHRILWYSSSVTFSGRSGSVTSVVKVDGPLTLKKPRSLGAPSR
jgi:hypothetical protein